MGAFNFVKEAMAKKSARFWLRVQSVAATEKTRANKDDGYQTVLLQKIKPGYHNLAN